MLAVVSPLTSRPEAASAELITALSGLWVEHITANARLDDAVFFFKPAAWKLLAAMDPLAAVDALDDVRSGFERELKKPAVREAMRTANRRAGYAEQVADELASWLERAIRSSAASAAAGRISDNILEGVPDRLAESVHSARKIAASICSKGDVTACGRAVAPYEFLGSEPCPYFFKLLRPGSRGEIDHKEFPELEELARAIEEGKFHCRLVTQFPKVNEAQLSRWHARYGAKAARLIALYRDLPRLKPFFDRIHLPLSIPAFRLLPVEVHAAFRAGRSIEAPLRMLHAAVKGREVLVRSSAVRAEDGDELMGAGIYESVRLPARASFAAFQEAVVAVYESAESERARSYRAARGIADESMGALAHLYISSAAGTAGYVNSIRAQIPELSDVTLLQQQIPPYSPGASTAITTSSAAVAVVKRAELMCRMIEHGIDESLLALPVESRNVAAILQLAAGGLLLERYFGRPVQYEFCSENVLHLFQARPLPPGWSRKAAVTFPEREDFIWRGRAVGVLDAELPVLGRSLDNYKKEGLLILVSAFNSGRLGHELDQLLPGKGAVWLLQPSPDFHGHVETRCLERGLTIISGESLPGERGDALSCGRLQAGYAPQPLPAVAVEQAAQVLEPHAQFMVLRVVANGLEARVYK